MIDLKETFARDFIEALIQKDPKQFGRHKFDDLQKGEKEWIMDVSKFMVDHGWRKE